MYDVNPLGPLMHLKELERQAVPRLRRARAAEPRNISLRWASLGLAMTRMREVIDRKVRRPVTRER